MARCILTVDDSASIRQAVGSTLRRAGYPVIEAVDGVDAQDKITPQVGLVLTDLTMPRLDGIGLIRALRSTAEHRSTPILVLTTACEHERKAESRAAGATGWIVKPFRPEQLVDVVKKVLA